MEKKLALSFIGGTPTRAAVAIGVSRSAISQWPDPLPPSLVDRVLAAWVREHVADLPTEFRPNLAQHAADTEGLRHV